jgi:hypothetical protein
MLPLLSQMNFHWFALPRDDVQDGFLDVLIFPQPARASVARPALPIQPIDSQAVQVAARIRLESVHDFLGTNVRFHYCMNVIGSHMCCAEIPATVRTDFAESVEYCRAAVLVEEIGRLVHLPAFHRDTLWIGFCEPASGYVVASVDRTGLIAVQVRPIASESDEVSHKRAIRYRSITVAAQPRIYQRQALKCGRILAPCLLSPGER